MAGAGWLDRLRSELAYLCLPWVVLLGTWPEDQRTTATSGTYNYTPNSFMIESETGDFYFAANSASNGTGSYWNQMWRMTADGSYATILYSTDGTTNTGYWTAGMVFYTQEK